MNAICPDPSFLIPDLQSGMAQLSRLPLANPVAAEQQLVLLLDSLLAAPPDAADLLALLEQARVPLCFVEEELARRYHNKPLALGDVEEAYFQAVISAWEKMGRAYALCAQLEEPDATNPDYGNRVALILHRCIYYTGMIILEHYRARREVPPGVWLDLHGYFETAEEWGVADLAIEDSLEHESQLTHCMAAYATLLLIDLASPYSQTVRDLNLIRRWAGQWSPMVAVLPLNDQGPAPAYVVELMKDAPLHPHNPGAKPGQDARQMMTERLTLQLRQMLTQLKQRITPSQLGLGEETGSHVIRLLEQLARPWSLEPANRRFRRFASAGTAKVCCGFEAMHYAVTTREFVQPDAVQTYSRGEFDELFTFRDRASPTQPLSIRAQGDYPVDVWSVINHSASGFRLRRSAAGQKITHGQLLAFCPHDGEEFLLGHVTWLMQDGQGHLIVGIALLPGLPAGVGVRSTGAHPGIKEPYSRAFLLPAVHAIAQEASIVIPAGFYQASRVIEVHGSGTWLARLKHILQRGADFDRVSFELV